MLTRCTFRTGSVPDFRAKRATLGANLTAPHARSDRRAAPRLMVGTTLIELMVTISIAAILMTIAAPSFQNIVATNRIAAVTNEFSAALQLARSEAVTRGKTVTVCKSDDITDATPTCNTAANWQDGWVIFVDNNNNGVLDTGEIPLKVGQPPRGNAVISTGTKFQDYVKLKADGRVLGAGNLANGTFAICITPNQRTIVINLTGRIRIATGTCP